MFAAHKKFHYQHKNGHVAVVLARLSIEQNKNQQYKFGQHARKRQDLIDTRIKTILD